MENGERLDHVNDYAIGVQINEIDGDMYTCRCDAPEREQPDARAGFGRESRQPILEARCGEIAGIDVQAEKPLPCLVVCTAFSWFRGTVRLRRVPGSKLLGLDHLARAARRD